MVKLKREGPLEKDMGYALTALVPGSAQLPHRRPATGTTAGEGGDGPGCNARQ
jgi:hypothetical protein